MCSAHPTPKDSRLQALLGSAWHQLPQAVRRRFSKPLAGGESTVYRGKVTALRMTRAGQLLAQAARLIGAPLPYDRSSLNQPAVVSVTEDKAGGGQFWVRQYGRAGGFPQVIHSSKRFAGPTGIEEYLGYGLGIALQLKADCTSIHFTSDHIFLKLGRRKLRLPRWLQPGVLTVSHHDMGHGQFRFSLTLTSPLFGDLIHQDALFHDMED